MKKNVIRTYELLNRALKLRKSNIVNEYRQWEKEIVNDIDIVRVLTKRIKEITKITEALERELEVKANKETKIRVKIGAKVAAFGLEIGAEISLERNINLKNTLG
jgi:hypothetical protein